MSTYEFVKLQTELKDTYEKVYYQEGNDKEGVPYRHQTIDDYRNDSGVDWQDEAFKPTWSQGHDISVSGGQKGTTYAASFSHYDEDGIFTNSGYKKNAGKLRIDSRLVKR